MYWRHSADRIADIHCAVQARSSRAESGHLKRLLTVPAPSRRPLRCLHLARCGIKHASASLQSILLFLIVAVYSGFVQSACCDHTPAPRVERKWCHLPAQVQLVGDSKAALVEQERALLTDALALLDEVCPEVGGEWGRC